MTNKSLVVEYQVNDCSGKFDVISYVLPQDDPTKFDYTVNASFTNADSAYKIMKSIIDVHNDTNAIMPIDNMMTAYTKAQYFVKCQSDRLA